jgi:threonine synthase
MILDPHTAVGVGTAKKLKFDNNCVVLATAHPCKFPGATNKAIKKHKELPEKLKSILIKKERFDTIGNNVEEVKNYIKKKLKL